MIWHSQVQKFVRHDKILKPGVPAHQVGKVPARVITTDPVLNVELARSGIGLTLVTEVCVRNEVARGVLVPVLEPFSTPFPGFYLYDPQLKRASPSLRAFVEYLRALREPKRRR